MAAVAGAELKLGHRSFFPLSYMSAGSYLDHPLFSQAISSEVDQRWSSWDISWHLCGILGLADDYPASLVSWPINSSNFVKSTSLVIIVTLN